MLTTMDLVAGTAGVASLFVLLWVYDRVCEWWDRRAGK